MKQRISFVWIVLLAALLLPRTAAAVFHVMEVEQVIGGVQGDTTAQAIQLRQRIANQNVLNGTARLVVRDAAGANPVTLTNFNANEPNFAACARILIATPSFLSKTTPATTSDFPMIAAIPPGYLAAGSLTFEAVAGGTIYWRVSWGGGSYSGAQNVDLTNDNDGSTAPPFAGALPSGSAQALRFQPPCGTTSTTTAAQYAATAGASTWNNNNTTNNFLITAAPPVPGLPASARLVLPAMLGLAALTFALIRRRAA